MSKQSSKTLSLVIVQNRETQFDAPLYAQIHKLKHFHLEVIYTDLSATRDACDQELGFPPQWDHISSVDYHRTYLSSVSPLAIWRLSLRIYRQNPSLVLICGYYPRYQLLLAVFLRILGQRIGLRSDNTLIHTKFYGITGLVRRFGVAMIQRLFDTWHPVGDQAHAYLRFVSRSKRPVFRFAYSVDNDWFANNSNSARLNRSSFLNSMGWPHDSFVIIGIMKWTYREDPITLIKAFQNLIVDHLQARLILIGDGPLRDLVKSACCSIQHLVCLPGYVKYSELPSWYGISNVFVHPAPDEPWGVSVNEALACGLPVIAAEGVGAAAELLLSTEYGSVFPNGDFKALTHLLHLETQRSYRDLISTLAKTAVDRFHYRHTIQELAKSLSAE